MGWFKSQMWKVIDWKDDSSDTMVYRFQMPSDKYEIMSGSKLTVRESQVAVFVHKGKIADIFQPGQYTLSTNNLPILSGLRALLYQGRDVVVKSDVYFVSTKQFTNLKWGTKNPITMRDADFGMVRVGAFGTYSMRVFDAEKFLKELFGTNSAFTVSDIHDHLKSLLVSQMADTVAESKIPMLDMAANLQEFSAMCRTNIMEKFREFGLDITSFTIENISLPQEVEKVLDERTQPWHTRRQNGHLHPEKSRRRAGRRGAQHRHGGHIYGRGYGRSLRRRHEQRLFKCGQRAGRRDQSGNQTQAEILRRVRGCDVPFSQVLSRMRRKTGIGQRVRQVRRRCQRQKVLPRVRNQSGRLREKTAVVTALFQADRRR